MIIDSGAPADPLVSVAEMKRYLHSEDEHDATLADLSGAARAWIENYCCVRFGTRTTEIYTDSLPESLDLFSLGVRPVLGVDSVEYLDDAYAWQPVPLLDYYFDGLSTIIKINDWPELTGKQNSVRITVQAGHAAIPADVKMACKLYVLGIWDDVDQTSAVVAHLAPYVYR